MALDVKTVDENNDSTKQESPQQEISNAATIAQQELLLKQQKEIDEMRKMITELVSSKSQAPNQGLEGTKELVTTIISEMKKRSDNEKYGSDKDNYINEDELDPEDVLDKGVSFYCHSGGYVIVDDKKNGHKVPTPFRNNIVFNHLSTNRSGSGKDLKVEVISRYVSTSKKEVEWLRNSSFYGWKIFDDIQVAKSSHAKIAFAINRFLTGVRTMDKTSFFNACKEKGIGMSKDLEAMRLQYAQILAEEEVKREEDNALFRAKNAIVEKALLSS